MTPMGGMHMTDEPQSSVQGDVRAQFDRQVAHYLQGSAMADEAFLEHIVSLARPRPEMRVVDIACGAGFLA
jgi:2-polyprenyl-3-methyl-5-hydroxy-6-metoxy-1,4-benzoquinol methylase